MALRIMAMEPANRIIAALGGPTKVADQIGVHRVTVSKWKRPAKDGGTGGIIPIRHVPGLIAMAKSQGVPLNFDDFLPKQKGAA